MAWIPRLPPALVSAPPLANTALPRHHLPRIWKEPLYDIAAMSAQRRLGHGKGRGKKGKRKKKCRGASEGIPSSQVRWYEGPTGRQKSRRPAHYGRNPPSGLVERARPLNIATRKPLPRSARRVRALCEGKVSRLIRYVPLPLNGRSPTLAVHCILSRPLRYKGASRQQRGE